jgi:hypothetical protein
VARFAGRNGRLYVSLDGTAAPSPVLYLKDFSIDQTVTKIDVTAFGDTNLTKIAGLPDFSGTASGFYDGGASGTGSDALYNAALDGLARNSYLYLSALTPTVDYFYGQLLFDFSVSSSVGGAVEITTKFEAAGPISFKNA